MTQDPPQRQDDAAHRPASEPNATALFRESLVIYAVVFILVLILALTALGVSIIAANLYALVAVVFVSVPRTWMSRKQLEPDTFGLSTQHWPKQVMWGLLATFVTLVPFAAGQYVWETQIRKQKAEFSVQNYAHWPIELDGQPQNWGKQPGVWVWGRKGNLYMGLRGGPKQKNKLILKADKPFLPTQLGGVLMRRYTPSGQQAKGPLVPGTHWEILPRWHHRPVTIVIKPTSIHKGQALTAPGQLTITQKTTKQDTPWPIYHGPDAKKQSSPKPLKRGYLWMLLWVVTQLFFIALPEEYFYRGYLQTRLQQAFERRDGKTRQWLGFTPAIVVTSILFGLGHLLIPVQGVLLGTRFSVFFPSLLFGWLRRQTGSIVAPTVYHAGCNLMVLFLGTHYF